MNREPLILSFLFAIILSGKAPAQSGDSTLQALTSYLSEYTEKIPWEEIYVHSDREEYISGEDFWFNVYLFDRKSLKLSDVSKIAYLEVLNSANQPVVQNRILISNGTGPGHFVIPDTLSTGYYMVRAYTNWMKNFLPGNCFMKEIVIYNTLKQEETKPARHVISAITDSFDKQKLRSFNLVVKYRPDSLRIILETDNGYSIENPNKFYVVVQTRGSIDYANRLLTSGPVASVSVSRNSLTAGINQITIFDDSGKPVAEKLIFTPSVNSDSCSIQAKSRFATRSKIEIVAGTPLQGKFSVSVAPATEFMDAPGIEEYLVFGSEFNSAERAVSWKILKGKSEEETDSILSGLSSSWIRWPELTAGIWPAIRYPHEDEYHYLKGNVPDGNKDTVLLCIPGKAPWFQYTVADEKGYFTFKLHIDEELHDIVIMTNSNGKRIILESSFLSVYMQNRDGGSYEEILPLRFSKLGVNFQVMKIFRTSVRSDSAGTVYTKRPVSFYGKPQNEIRLSDYVELPTMSEVFIELIPDVSLRQRRSGYEIIITDRISDRRFVFHPTLMIDGVITSDASLIADISPELVEKIDVVNRKYLVGDYLFDGIVNIITKTGDFSVIPMPEYMVRTGYRVAEPVPAFISPVYSGNVARKSRIPDYRNTLYWSPSLPGSNRIEFWSSDNKLNYFVNIQGVTAEGKPLSIRKTFSVE